MMLLLVNVAVLADVLYFAVNVLLPAVRPVTRYVALNCIPSPFFPLQRRAVASLAARVVFPLTAKAMKLSLSALVLSISDVRVTSALPEAGIVTVTAGPAVVRSV